ncbi:MAG: secretin N-terminal domain-containing protein [Acidobacteriota bacterium]
MMTKIAAIILFALICPALASSTSVVTFVQLATTAKREGTAPVVNQLPATVGAPPPRPRQEQPQPSFLEVPEAEPVRDDATEAGDATTEEPQTTAPPSGVSSSNRGVRLELDNAPLQSAISMIMQELGYSYIIDPAVSGTVSLFSMGEIPRDKLFEVLERLLKMNGQAIVKQEGIYTILPIGKSPKIPHNILRSAPEPASSGGAVQEAPAEAAQPQPEAEPEAEPAPESVVEPAPQESSEPQGSVEVAPRVLQLSASFEGSELEDQQGVITYIIPLNYIPSSEMLTMITPFLSEGATVIDFASGNMLLVTDFRTNVQQALNLVKVLDTQYFDINTVELIPVRYNKAADVATDLAKIFAPSETTSGVRIVAIERLNSILAVTHSPEVLQEVKAWMGRLDAPSANTNIKTFVYQVENNRASSIAEVLAQLYQDGRGLPSGVGPPAEGEERAAAQREPEQEAAFVPPFGQQQGGLGTLGPSLANRNTQSTIRAVVSGNVKIIVNEFNNSLIIQATEADYNFLLQTIELLDVLPRQVLIEAKVYSVELTDDLRFGVSAFLQERGAAPPAGDGENGNGNGAAEVVTVPTTGQIAGAGAGQGTFSLTTRAFIGAQRQLEALITALRSRTNVEVLEAPRLLAMDGMQAQINVGAEVPVTTASFGDPLRAGDSVNFINSIQFRSTGTTLLIVPRITASGIVTMDLALEVSSAAGTSLTPTINRNYVSTSLIVRDGQTAAIGGIISDQLINTRDRVPVLGDIPILGALFGQTSSDKRRAELIFLITPHVIQNLPTSTELRLDFQRAMRRAYGVIRETEAEEEKLIRERRQEELEQQR